MKSRNLTTLLAIIISFLCVKGYASNPEAVFNVATYNLRQLNSGDDANGNGWEVRHPVIAQIIRFHDFDIFGTQEGFKSQLEDIKALLPGYDYIGVAREDGKESGEHSAIFYDTAKFELINHGDFWLSETPDVPGLGWDAACMRICSWGIFRHKQSGKTFQFYNLHLDHVGNVARVESIKLVQEKMKELGQGLPTFLTGDFNVDQKHSMYEVLASSDMLADSFHIADYVFALNGTYNGYQTDGFTDSRIDHIFVSKGVKVEKYGVLTDTYRTKKENPSALEQGDRPTEITVNDYESRVPSDHFPVIVRVSF